MLGRCVALVAAVAGCTDECEAGIELGTGDRVFAPMPDRLPLEYRGQALPYLTVNPRIRGIPPGSEDLFDPANPRTRVTGVLVEDPTITIGVDHPSTLSYVPMEDGCTCQLEQGFRLDFGTTMPDFYVGKHFVISVEVVGSNAVAVHAEKQIEVYDVR